MKEKNSLTDLILTFMKIGLFTFGGGYAMIAMMEHTCVEEKGWISHEEMMDITVIAESTPGPIAINCATFTGYRQAGLPGALTATLGITLPSFCIILLISLFFDRFLEVSLIANAFKGIKVAVAFLILQAAAAMLKKMKRAVFPRAVMVCACAAMLLTNCFSLGLSSITLMLLAALVSLALFFLKQQKGRAAK